MTDVRRGLVAVAIIAAVALGATFAVVQVQHTAGGSTTSQSASGGAGLGYPPGTRFVRIMTLDSGSKWTLDGHDAQQVLGMITQLKPDSLERFIGGPQNVSATVPVAAGSPPMTVGQFLNASMKACGCYIIPRLSLQDYDTGKLLAESENLLALPVHPKMNYLSLDLWAGFSSTHTSDQVKAMFQQLYSQGWAGIGVNECDGYSSSYGYATFADFCVGTVNWKPDTTVLSSIRTEPNIKLDLLYIDFPQQMANFSALQPDQEAKIIRHDIAPDQATDGFTFVYPIAQDAWDSATRMTSQNGSFNGQSLYQVMKDTMTKFNAAGSPQTTVAADWYQAPGAVSKTGPSLTVARGQVG